MANGFAGGAATGFTSGLQAGSQVVSRGLALGLRGRELQQQQEQAEAEQRQKQIEGVAKDLKAVRDRFLAGVKDGSMNRARSLDGFIKFARGNASNYLGIGTTDEIEIEAYKNQSQAFKSPEEKTQEAEAAADTAARRAVERAPDVGKAEGIAARNATGAEDASDFRNVTGRDSQGNLVTQVIDLNKGERVITSGPSVQFEVSGLPGTTDATFKHFEASERFTRSAIESGLDLQNLIRQGGEAALSAPGTLAQGLVALVAQAKGFIDLGASDPENLPSSKFLDGTSTDTAPERAEGIFKKIDESGRLNALIKSNIVNLAFAAAASSGQSGRAISDKDFDRFVREIGASADPPIFIAVVDAVMKRINRNFMIESSILQRRVPEIGDARDILKEARGRRRGGSDKPLSEMTDEELVAALRARGSVR